MSTSASKLRKERRAAMACLLEECDLPVHFEFRGAKIVSQNEVIRKNYHYRSRERLLWYTRFIVAMHELKTPRHTDMPLREKLHVTITRVDKRQVDYDNLVGGCKMLVDAMVDACLLVDDSPEWATIEYKQEVGDARVIVDIRKPQ